MICGLTLFNIERYLKSHGYLKQVIYEVLKIAKNFKITKKNPLYLPNNCWKQVKNSFPKNKIKTVMKDCFHKKTEESCKMFCSTYLFKIINSYDWSGNRNISMTSCKDLIKYNAAKHILNLLKRQGNLYEFTLALIKIGQKMKYK